ncbi:MAG: DUF2752 domain-containing protein [Bacteroidales bacterium]|nr:DUF2752 domain-containing protein [Bacteroidales bacterium]
MKKKTAAFILAVIAVVVLILVYALLDPASLPFPRCPFLMLTGFKCPGCGSQRALHQLLGLHIGEAFRYNAALVVCIPLVAFLFAADLFKKRLPRLYGASRHPALGWTVLAALLAWWLLRNVFGW